MTIIKQLTAALLLCIVPAAYACTDFRTTAKDGTVMVARSLEFALDLKSNIRTSTRGRVYTTTGPDGKPGMTWKAKYGYVFLDGLDVDMSVDGMNEKGLSFEALYLPTLAKYQTVPAGKNKQALPYLYFGDWVMSNFETVDQVKQALSSVYVFEQKIAAAGDQIFPLHFAIYDATGKSIVVEYIDGKLNVHDNEIGVMTNSPSYDWHITNLRNYVQLIPTNPNPVIDSGVQFFATGQGYGMMGLPGDISPPSRFVKIATLTRVALPVADAAGALNLANHIMNNVDIPLGLARENNGNNVSNESTEWVVFKDLTHSVFYYRTYDDLNLRAVDLTKLNFAENAPRLKMPIAGVQTIEDRTAEFLKSTQ